MTLETQSAFARRLGCDRARVTRMKQRGELVGEDGRVMSPKSGLKINVEASLARMADMGVGQQRPDVAERHAAARGKALETSAPAGARAAASHAEEDGEPPIEGESGEESGLARNQRVALHYQNGLAKIDMALKMGNRFMRRDVVAEGREVGNALRAALERMIDQTAPRLALEGDPDSRARLIADQAAKVRALVNRQFPAALRRLRDAARSGKAA